MSRRCPECRRRKLYQSQPSADRFACENCGWRGTLEEITDSDGLFSDSMNTMSNDTSGRPTYSDEQFREHVPEETGHYVATFKIANAVGCVWQTANRRLADLSREEGIDIVDLEAGELVDPDTLDGSGRPMFGVGMDLATALGGPESRRNGGRRVSHPGSAAVSTKSG